MTQDSLTIGSAADIRFKPYPAYKTSGVEWLGEIPKNWEIRRLKSALTLSCEKNGPIPFGEMLSVSGYRGIELKQYEHEEQRRLDTDLEDYRVVRRGQLVANTMWLNYTGLGVSELEGHVSPAYRCYNIKAHFHGRYLHHLMRSRIYVERYCSLLYGIRPNSLQIKNHDWDDIELLIPDDGEQIAVADFLDRETGKIDTLIKKKERLIELLNEKRSALISQAVTKGLDPNVPMKDSGIEWLGEIPEGWEVYPLKFVAPLQGGFAYDSDSFGIDGVPIVRMNNLRRGKLDLSEAVRVPERDCHKEFALCEGDLLLGLSGSTGDTGSLGNYAFVRERDVPCQLNQRVGRFQPGPSIFTIFLQYLIGSKCFTEPIILQCTGTAQYNVSPSSVGSVHIALPSIATQELVVLFLERQTEKIDELLEKVNDATEKLKEYRTALISAAVTGKIDVREEAV